MRKWFKKIISRDADINDSPDDDVDFVMEAARKLSEAAVQALEIAIGMAMIEPEKLDRNDMEYVCGYISGYCDVLAQGWGAKGGGSLSMTTTIRVLQELFGADSGEELFHFTDSCMSDRKPAFIQGLSAGGEDGNRLSEGKLPFGLVKHFQPHITGNEQDPTNS